MLVVVSLGLPSGRSTTHDVIRNLPITYGLRNRRTSEIIIYSSTVCTAHQAMTVRVFVSRIHGYTYIKTMNSAGIQFVSIHSVGRIRNHSEDIFRDD